MIMTDVYVPALDRTYNFSLNEDIAIKTVVTELIDMIERKEQSKFVGSRESLQLFDKQNETVLPVDNTLIDLHIMNGAQLILV